MKLALFHMTFLGGINLATKSASKGNHREQKYQRGQGSHHSVGSCNGIILFEEGNCPSGFKEGSHMKMFPSWKAVVGSFHPEQLSTIFKSSLGKFIERRLDNSYRRSWSRNKGNWMFRPVSARLQTRVQYGDSTVYTIIFGIWQYPCAPWFLSGFWNC